MSPSPKPTKVRLTVTVDADLAVELNAAVQAGEADSVSRWVNDALRAKSKEHRTLAALREAVAAYEAEFGEFTDEEMAAGERRDREAADAVRRELAARLASRAG